ncbi:MAG: hypothetical protein H2054_00560 [Sphingomonas sp.]|uniref:hypothetical protein n=1 Tax=Sphingomonas sp. TaxID=28214 RepID=UPI00185F22F1|nr:hypothetical protein [Zymomonas sp.]MBA4771581.1 hypothetical protein [Sphingomonas sp.]
MLRILALVPALAMVWVDPVSAAGLCAAASGVAKGRACVESPNGVAVADDLPRAQVLLADADAGAARFRTRFGRAPARFAVLETNDGNVDGGALSALQTAGFKAVLPFLSPKGFDLQIEASVRRAVEAQTAGLSADMREPIVQEAIAKVKAGRPPQTAQQPGVIAHELGHMWYIDAFWPGRELRGGHYGGPGPDWMDEVAAVLMEPESMASARIGQFGDRYRKLRAADALRNAPDNVLVDLPGFLNSAHPGAARGREMLAKIREEEPDALPKNGVMIRASSGPEAEKFAESAIHYYLQSTMAAEYLVARTGDPAVFARIAAAFGRGETMAQWLANNEPKGKLPRDLTALQADWLAWLDQRFPATSA